MDEFDLIDWIRNETAHGRGDVALGIGDDAAILEVPAGTQLVVSTDTLVAGVHFPDGTSPYDIGWKSLAVNLSDLAAMAATPAWVSLALTLPSIDRNWLRAFLSGFNALAKQHDVALIGGDCTRGPLTITATIHGFAPIGKAVRRSGAQVDDALVVFGALGRAAAGLSYQLARAASDRVSIPADTDIANDVLALNRPVPLNVLASLLRDHAHALIDVSDGLLQDLRHVLKQSGIGCTVALDSISEWPLLHKRFGDPAQDMVLAGGDDYALLAAIPQDAVQAVLRGAEALGVAATMIGRFEEARGCRVTRDGLTLVLPERSGFNHFA